MDYKATLINLLGLAPESADEAITNASQSFQSDMLSWKTNMEAENEVFKNRVQEADASKEAAETLYNTALETNKTLVVELATRDLEKFADVITNADEVREQLLDNREGTLKILNGIKRQGDKIANRTPMHDPAAVRQPGIIDNVAAAEEDSATATLARKISNRASEIKAAKHCSFQQAFIEARGEHAELITN